MEVEVFVWRITMPFRSEKQRRFMYSQHPEIAKRWSKDYGGKIMKKKKKDKPKKKKAGYEQGFLRSYGKS